jgi:hypothetical protein
MLFNIMPGRNTHFSIALILLIVIYFTLDYFNFNLSNYSLNAVALLIGSVIPDIIEPAEHYTHRKYYHSKRFLKILYFSLPISLLLGIILNPILCVFFFVLGYISHLWLDSTTKMSLPE